MSDAIQYQCYACLVLFDDYQARERHVCTATQDPSATSPHLAAELAGIRYAIARLRTDLEGRRPGPVEVGEQARWEKLEALKRARDAVQRLTWAPAIRGPVLEALHDLIEELEAKA